MGTLLCPPASQSLQVIMPPTPLGGSPPEGARLQAEAGERTPHLRRELIVYGVALLFGLVAMPLLIWVGGNRVLGPYTHGQNNHAGPLALLEDFFLGLLHGSTLFWAVALGPALLLVLVRLFIRLMRALRENQPD
jgi:hypothetical protein